MYKLDLDQLAVASFEAAPDAAYLDDSFVSFPSENGVCTRAISNCQDCTVHTQ